MRIVYDQLGKGLLRGTLNYGGDLHPHHEVPSAPQTVDGWFGAVPAEIAAIVEATHEVARLERWLEKAAACSAEDVASELRAGERDLQDH